MKKPMLTILAGAAEKMIKVAKNDNSKCTYWSFKPEVPQNIKNFKK